VSRQYRLYFIGGPEDGTIRIVDRYNTYYHCQYPVRDQLHDNVISARIAEYKTLALPRSAELTLDVAAAIFQGWDK
jgi:hypothetical protein